jgi:transposase
MTNRKKSYIQTDINNYSTGGHKEYFQLPPHRVYKEKTPYFIRRKQEHKYLEDYGLKIDQEKLELPLVWSNDRMSITTPDEIKIKVNKTYSQDWESYNQAQTREKILFLELLSELTNQIPKQKYKGNGRPPTDIGEMLFSICMKTYLDFSSRRSESDIRLAQQLGYITHVPHFNTILKYLNKPELKEVLKVLVDVSAMPLRQVEETVAVDASGFSTSMFGRWFDVREKRSERRLFKKAHIVCGTKTNIIVSVEVTDGYVHDNLMFQEIVSHAFENFKIKELYADMGYSSRKNLQFVTNHKAIPSIPFKKNVRRLTKGYPIWSTMFNYFKYNRDKFMEHYHQRSNVESVFSMIKRKQGVNLKTKSDIGQVNEIMCKCLVHNICVLIQEMFELGIMVDFNENFVEEFMCKIEL